MQVEKMLLVYGWGKWTDIVKHGQFRRDLDELDISNISQAIVSTLIVLRFKSQQKSDRQQYAGFIVSHSYLPYSLA